MFELLVSILQVSNYGLLFQSSLKNVFVSAIENR